MISDHFLAKFYFVVFVANIIKLAILIWTRGELLNNYISDIECGAFYKLAFAYGARLMGGPTFALHLN